MAPGEDKRHQLHDVAQADTGTTPKVIQDLLTHASYGITMNVYDSALSDEKREAHSGVMRQVATVLKPVPGLRMVEWQLLDSSVVPVV